MCTTTPRCRRSQLQIDVWLDEMARQLGDRSTVDRGEATSVVGTCVLRGEEKGITVC